MLQQLLHLFKFEVHGLREASPYPDVTHEAHKYVHKKSGTGSKRMDHRQESCSHDKVAGPVCCGGQPRAHTSHGKAEEFALLPRNTAQATGISSDIKDE